MIQEWDLSFTGLDLVVKADAQLSVFAAYPASAASITPGSTFSGQGTCGAVSGTTVEATPLSATPVATLGQNDSPFHIEQAPPPAMAMVPALNGPLGFVLAGALAGYWLAVRKRR